MLVLLILRLLYYGITGKDVSDFWGSSDGDTFQIEDDLHAIRQYLEKMEQEENPKPESPYADMSKKELRQQAEEAEQKMEQMR